MIPTCRRPGPLLHLLGAPDSLAGDAEGSCHRGLGLHFATRAAGMDFHHRLGLDDVQAVVPSTRNSSALAWAKTCSTVSASASSPTAHTVGRAAAADEHPLTRPTVTPHTASYNVYQFGSAGVQCP